MALIKNTELGEISVSDDILLDVLEEATVSGSLKDLIWLSTSRGKIQSTIRLVSDQDIINSIFITYDEKGGATLRFCVVVKFGVSIRTVTKKLADEIAARTKELTGIYPREITILIAGVRSKNTVRRNLKVTYSYE